MSVRNVVIALAFLVFIIGMVMALIPTTRNINPDPALAPAPSDPATPAQPTAPAAPGNAPVQQQ